MPEKIVKENTAVLIMDYQPDILDLVPNQKEALLKKASEFLQVVRQQHIPIIYVRVAFRADYAEVDEANIMFSTIKKHKKLISGSPNADIHPMVEPQVEDMLVTKHRVNAFYQTPLELYLRSHSINTLIMFGVSTGGVVLSTLRDAADKDYHCIVIKDLCADKDDDVHNCLVEKVFLRQAEVCTVQDITKVF